MKKSIAEQVYDLANKYFDDYKESNGELSPRLCPMCSGGSSQDQHTMFINLETGAWMCHRGHHTRDSGYTDRGGIKELAAFFGENGYKNDNIIRFNTFKKKVYSKPDPDIIKPLTDEIVEYFAKRKISKETLEAFKVGSDENGNIAFPFYRNGELILIKYRPPHKFDKTKDKAKEWASPNAEPILFNIDNISFNKPLHVTEGMIDAMSLYEAGVHNVVSVPMGCNNFDWISIHWEILDKFPQIVLFGDADAPGIEMINTIARRLGEDRCALPPEYPELIYEGKDYGRVCKDANEILVIYGPEELKTCAENYTSSQIRGILNLADIQMEDPLLMPRLMFKIPELDRITGGFGEGSLLVTSGRRGEGVAYMPSLNTVNL